MRPPLSSSLPLAARALTWSPLRKDGPTTGHALNTDPHTARPPLDSPRLDSTDSAPHTALPSPRPAPPRPSPPGADSPGVLYLCGVPGTGKTACVGEVLAELRPQALASGAQVGRAGLGRTLGRG